MRRHLIVLAVLSITVLGCSSGGQSRPTTTTTPSATDGGGVPAVRLTQLTTAEEPIALVTHPRSKVRFVAERGGTIRPLGADGLGAPALDISERTSAQGERGLLGAAFAPDGSWLYVHYTNADGDTRVDAVPFADGRADPAGRREILGQDQPFPNHNGGALITGPDGLLYLALGDGGSQGDPQGNGQKLSTWLGKILRIEPTPTAVEPYRVPTDNPFVGTDGARPEIWTYGLRNPWRFSFDRANGDLWIGDVGGADREEINWRARVQAGGTNFGWKVFEGTQRAASGTAPNAVPPVFEYTHDAGGCSVVGGYVYRGTRIPALQGRYLYADYCLGQVAALTRADALATPVPNFALPAAAAVSFGEDADGELYVLSLDGPIYRLDPA